MFVDDKIAGLHTEIISEGPLGVGYRYVMAYMNYNDKNGNDMKTSM